MPGTGVLAASGSDAAALSLHTEHKIGDLVLFLAFFGRDFWFVGDELEQVVWTWGPPGSPECRGAGQSHEFLL